jgi:hypothetical protein
VNARLVPRARRGPVTARRLLLVLGLLGTGNFVACGDGGHSQGNTGDGGNAPGAAINLDAGIFNQCGVAAPPPASTGQCTAVTAPLITNFDDYAGGVAANYTYYVNAKPPASNAVLGAIQHIGDGSDSNGGTSVIATDMVAGEGGSGYALQISDTDATNWGGLLVFYFPQSGSSPVCLNAAGYQGVEFSIQGAAPSGNFGVSLRMLDTIPVASNGLCDDATANDCKDATIQLPLPADATTWTQVQLPWSAFTPGVGSATACIPVTGQNIVSLVIQPLMSYPPPNYTLQPGPYAIAVDNVQFY